MKLFDAGDVVRLKRGGVDMTVVIEHASVLCEWLSPSGTKHSATFHHDALHLVRPAPK